MSRPGRSAIRILLVEDDLEDVELVREALADDPRFHFVLLHAARFDRALEMLDEEDLDVVLLDLWLPDASGLDTLAGVRGRDPDCPIVILTGLNDESFGVEAVRHGAQDYLVKGEIHGGILARAIRYAISRKGTELALRASEARARAVLNTTGDGVIVFDGAGVIQVFNAAAEPIFQVAAEEIVGGQVGTLLPALAEPASWSLSARTCQTMQGRRSDGTVLSLEVVISQLLHKGQRLITAIVRERASIRSE